MKHQKVKDFITKLYCYDHKPVTKNDELHIEIKENVVEESEDCEVGLLPKLKREN